MLTRAGLGFAGTGASYEQLDLAFKRILLGAAYALKQIAICPSTSFQHEACLDYWARAPQKLPRYD